jgi:hypothetical protein
MAAVLHEVPLPPPDKPERERTRNPQYETTISVGAAGAWVADVHRAARELAGRSGGGVAVAVELEDGRRLEAFDLRTGPGDGFVTLSLDGSELAVRLDRVVGVELAPTGEAHFRVRDAGFGFER